MTDEEIMDMHAESGKFGEIKKGKMTQDYINHLNNRLTVSNSLAEIATLLEQILETEPSFEWLNLLLEHQSIERVALAWVKLKWRHDSILHNKRKTGDN